MAEDPVRDGKKFDPMEPWRGVRDVYMDAWGKTMVDMVNSEAYAQATGAVLDTYLTVSAPFREAIEKAMLKTLEQLAMPTRADVVSIAERMTNIEMRLDDLDAKLDSIQRLITHAGAASRTSPQPSRPQPPKKKTISAKKVVAKKAAKRGKK
jgi:polyhydroxyalkanoic acid synthase PhaR subunit